MVNTAHQQLARNFARWDAQTEERQTLVDDLKSILSKIAYLRTLGRDVDRALEDAPRESAPN
jgi:hypothetical protein